MLVAPGAPNVGTVAAGFLPLCRTNQPTYSAWARPGLTRKDFNVKEEDDDYKRGQGVVCAGGALFAFAADHAALGRCDEIEHAADFGDAAVLGDDFLERIIAQQP